LFHLLGGKRAGWKPMRVKMAKDTHWFLQHTTGIVIDPTKKQFGIKRVPYGKAVGCGFLTKKPSRRAKKLMKTLVWQ
jgi:hypothetical protein